MGKSESLDRRAARLRQLRRLPLAIAVCMAVQPAWAQQADTQKKSGEPQTATLDNIQVTAQKRSQNLQDVPISVQAIGEETLERHNVASFEDYAKLIPSLSYQTIGGGVFNGPGFMQVYMRGVNSGGDGNHSGSQPSVGTYLDEQPITTIQGALDVHMYDIARVEALAGPQGTLYGASSQAGTLKIVTNKPDPSGFAASYGVEANAISGGGIGHIFEGMLNVPISDKAAIRLVGWQKHKAGYVDNMPGARQFPIRDVTIPDTKPSWGGVVDNRPNCTTGPLHVCSGQPKDNYNDANILGARAALRIDLNDNWTITPAIMAQRSQAHGSTGYDPKIGDLKVMHFYPEGSKDRWYQAALTVEGKIGNFDLTYAFSHLKRDVDSDADYTDYGFWYDTLASYGAYFNDDAGNLINPSQYIHAVDGYGKTSHELRLASPQDRRFRFLMGAFWQKQSHDILQNYRVNGLASAISVPGWEDTIWLTAQQRNDGDRAIFGEASFDITPALTLTGGLRFFHAQNSLKGFFGYGAGFSGTTGQAACFANQPFHGAPCINLDKSTSEHDHIGRLNLSWKIDDRKMLYATWSEGYRPGGINRRGTVPPYQSDFLTNYEFGWKTSWADNTVRFNGAVFREDWNNFQFSYLGQNGLTEIRNAGQARITGMEADLQWKPTYGFTISGGLALYNARLTKDYCAKTLADGVTPDPVCYQPNPPDRALAGSRLPSTPRFKGNLTGRYEWNIGEFNAYFQGAVFHQGDRVTDLREAQRALLGNLKSYTTMDLSAGFDRDNWSVDFYLNNVFNTRGQLARFAQCATLTCGNQPYTVVTQPRTFGVRFSQKF